jgi:hypothetical protein
MHHPQAAKGQASSKQWGFFMPQIHIFQAKYWLGFHAQEAQ